MGFFFFRTPEEKEALRQAEAHREKVRLLSQQVSKAEALRREKDLRSLAQGGIPVKAQERLREIQDGTAGYSSDLSSDEFALLQRSGYRVKGLVVGNAVYHVGVAYVGYQDGEVGVLTAAYMEATRLAVSRLRQEAQAIGAHGVVGVRVGMIRHEWLDHCIELKIFGTAVEGPGKAPNSPWLCDLGVAEWYGLMRAGYQAVDLVWGHCTWFVRTTPQDEMTESWGFMNREMEHWSHSLWQARDRAMHHLQEQTHRAEASGVVGMRFTRRLDRIETSNSDDRIIHHNLVLSMFGTAIRPNGEPPRPVRATLPMLSLRGRRMESLSLQDTAFED